MTAISAFYEEVITIDRIETVGILCVGFFIGIVVAGLFYLICYRSEQKIEAQEHEKRTSKCSKDCERVNAYKAVIKEWQQENENLYSRVKDLECENAELYETLAKK